MKPVALISCAALAFCSAAVSAKEITLPVETKRLADSAQPGAALATSLCYTCHSAEYVMYQPPTSGRAYWKATVVKMQKVFGAPIPDSALDPLTDYLVKIYGTETAAPTPIAPPPAAKK